MVTSPLGGSTSAARAALAATRAATTAVAQPVTRPAGCGCDSCTCSVTGCTFDGRSPGVTNSNELVRCHLAVNANASVPQQPATVRELDQLFTRPDIGLRSVREPAQELLWDRKPMRRGGRDRACADTLKDILKRKQTFESVRHVQFSVRLKWLSSGSLCFAMYSQVSITMLARVISSGVKVNFMP
jgi:hypothetical protein